MATVPLTSVLGRLRQVVLRHDGSTDAQLLALFIGQRDEAAFEALLRRHGPMVLGVCRRVLGNEADAEDAFQATFLVLVRKAGSLAQRALLSNWLYGVAHRTALKAKAMNRTRRAKENAAAKPDLTATADLGQEFHGLLDEALARLPDKYRVPVVLCELEGKPLKEAAKLLGCPQGTVASRLARGRAMLAKRMSRGGVSSAGLAAAGVLSQSAARACVPGPLIGSTIKAATVMAAGQAATAGVISAHVLALTEGVLKAMLQSKLKIAALGLVLVAVIGWGAGGSAYPQVAAPGGGGAAPAESQQRDGRVKWEYKALTRTAVEKLAAQGSKNMLTDGLNVLGNDAWELVGIDQGAALPGMNPGFGGGGGAGAGGPGAVGGSGAPGGGPPGFGSGMRPPSGSTYVFKRMK